MMLNNGMFVNEKLVSFHEYYVLQEGMMDTISDIGKTAMYFSKQFLMLLKSKDKKSKLIQILKEMKEDYNHYYTTFMNKIHEILYTNYKTYKRDASFRYDIHVFLMLLLSLSTVPISVNTLNKIYPAKDLIPNIQKHHGELVKSLSDIKKAIESNTETNSKKEFDVNELGF
jgi:hypothetical protein